VRPKLVRRAAFSLVLASTLVLAATLAGAARAEATPAPAPAPAATEPPPAAGSALKWTLEVKSVYRDSEDKAFPVPFSITGLPPLFLRTVDPGSNLEIPAVTLYLDARWGDDLVGHVRMDAIDLYYRNPTSTDHNYDVHEAWLRLGHDPDPGRLPAHWGAYAKVGKFPKFERQNDRHLESYGLVSTAFNRTEDIGVESGVDLGPYVVLKGSYTRGNPLFIRDPNALAGDNGTEANLANPPHPALNSGVPILYDAEVEDVNGGGHEQVGAGLGIRLSNADGTHRAELLGFARHRTLADRVELFGTLYGGDLRVLVNPQFGPYPGMHGIDKDERGGNLWVYWGGLSLFGQYVDQEIAGLKRTGYEGELAWRFELPLFASFANQQLFPSIQPAVRYSKLEPDFLNPLRTPVPSLAWPWEKTDIGLRLGIVPGTDLTVEQAHNRFLTKAGWRTMDEVLATLRWRF
jgi:hypothetical protein